MGKFFPTYRDESHQARPLGYHHVRGGGVTFVSRFGSALNLNPPHPILMLDGVYGPPPDRGQPTFVAVPPPNDQQVQHLIEPAAVRLIQPLEKRDVLADTETNALPEQPPVWSGLTARPPCRAPHGAERALIVPSASHEPASDMPPGVGQTPPENTQPSAHPTPPRSTPMTWAQLLASVFLADALEGSHGGARLPWIAVLTEPDSIRTYLTGVGLPAEAPTIAPPRPPPQQELDFAYGPAHPFPPPPTPRPGPEELGLRGSWDAISVLTQMFTPPVHPAALGTLWHAWPHA